MADNEEIEDFLAAHDPFVRQPLVGAGEVFGEWRITAFLGRGGSAEVYRAVHVRLETVVAIKVLVRETENSRHRFVEEARLLSQSLGDVFPRFYGYSEREGRPYMVEEYLEPYDLPVKDRDVAAFLLRICEGVGILHGKGLIHRDLKPQNIMRRVQTGDPVLIDLGLIKNAEGGSSAGLESVSIVDGRAVAVGTPGFSAPEQFTGGAVTPATDVHALGAIANACFAGRPPFLWRGIIRRATSSIPGQRYETPDALARAIRHRRHIGSLGLLILSALTFVGALVLALSGPGKSVAVEVESPEEGVRKQEDVGSPMSEKRNANADKVSFMQQIQEAMLGIESKGLRRQTVESAWKDVAEETETNGCRVVKVWLDDRIVTVRDPIFIEGPARAYIMGPGTLDADLTGTSNVAVRIMNRGVLLNRTKCEHSDSDMSYTVGDECYLNFVNLDWPKEKSLRKIAAEGELSMIDYRGPLLYRDAQIKRYRFLDKALREDEENRRKARSLKGFGIQDEVKGF